MDQVGCGFGPSWAQGFAEPVGLIRRGQYRSTTNPLLDDRREQRLLLLGLQGHGEIPRPVMIYWVGKQRRQRGKLCLMLISNDTRSRDFWASAYLPTEYIIKVLYRAIIAVRQSGTFDQVPPRLAPRSSADLYNMPEMHGFFYKKALFFSAPRRRHTLCTCRTSQLMRLENNHPLVLVLLFL